MVSSSSRCALRTRGGIVRSMRCSNSNMVVHRTGPSSTDGGTKRSGRKLWQPPGEQPPIQRRRPRTRSSQYSIRHRKKTLLVGPTTPPTRREIPPRLTDLSSRADQCAISAEQRDAERRGIRSAQRRLLVETTGGETNNAVSNFLMPAILLSSSSCVAQRGG